MPDPLWRRSPVVLVRHYPAYALALLVGAAAFTVTTLSGPTFVDAAEIELLRGQAEAVPSSESQSEQAVVRAALFDAPSDLEDEAALRVEAIPGTAVTTVRRPIRYQDSEQQARPLLANDDGDSVVAVPFQADGALDALRPVAGSPEPGCEGSCLWLPDTVADELGVGPGDRTTLRLELPDGSVTGRAAATVTGVYATQESGAPAAAGVWSRIGEDLPPWPTFAREVTRQVPLVVCDLTTYRRVIERLEEKSLTTWDAVPAVDPVRIDDAAMVTDGLRDLEEALSERSDPLADALMRAQRPLSVVSGLPDMVDAARAGRSAVVDGISALRVVGIGFAWLVVVLAAVGLLRRRATERQALADGGRSGVELTAVLMAEALVPVAAGTVAGLVACVPLVETLVGAEGRGALATDLVAVVAVLVATVAGASLLDHAARVRRGAGRRTASVPWRAVVLTGAAACAFAAYADDGPGLGPLTSVLPLAAVLVAAIALGSGATALLRRARLPRGTVPRLVVARLARDRSAEAAFLVAAVTFGTLSMGLYFADSVGRAVDDKVAAQVGAETTAQVESAREAAAVRLDAPVTTVWRVVASREDGPTTRVLAVDPEAFAEVALHADELVGDALGRLEGGGDDVPALVVGDRDGWEEGARRRLARDPWEVTARAVGHLEAFPGMGDADRMVVVPAETLFEALGPDAPTRLPASADDPDGSFDTELWSTARGDDVLTAADRAGVFLRRVSTAEEVRVRPVLVARGWVTDYLRVSTFLALGLGLVVLSGLHRQDADRRRILGRTLADLGHPPGLVGRAAAWQLAVVSASGALAGIGASYAATLALAGRLDPLPDLAPGLAVTGLGRAVLSAVVLVVLALVLTLVGSRRGRSVNELLQEV